MERQEEKQVLPFMQRMPEISQWPIREAKEWPDVLNSPKREQPPEEIKTIRKKYSSKVGKTVRMLMQTYLRQRDAGRILRLGITMEDGDARGWAAISLTKLGYFKEAASMAAGQDGQTPCGYMTLRWVANAMGKAGAIEAAVHLARLQLKQERTSALISNEGRAAQSLLEACSLFLQSTAANKPRLLAAHAARASLEIETIANMKAGIMQLTPNRRFLMLTEAFNQLIRWYGRARLVPQALRACEMMNELGIPRDEMTIHFLAKGCAQQYKQLKRARRSTQAPPDWPGRRPEVVFIGRVNSGKSSMINSLFSTAEKFAPASKTRAFTRSLDFYEVNEARAGLPYFMIVDTPGLGFAEVESKVTRDWPDLIYNYFRTREALKHVFHFCDARNKKLLPADKQLLHLLAKAQRKSVKYTIVITKIDVCTRKLANATANAIREELAPYVDVDIMFASARSLRGVDHLWSKIWDSVTDTPRGRRHKEIAWKELMRLRQEGPGSLTKEPTLADKLGLPNQDEGMKDFDEEWAEDTDIEPGTRKKEKGVFFQERWGEALPEEEDDPQAQNVVDAEEVAADDDDLKEDDAEADETMFSEEKLAERWESFGDEVDWQALEAEEEGTAADPDPYQYGDPATAQRDFPPNRDSVPQSFSSGGSRGRRGKPDRSGAEPER